MWQSFVCAMVAAVTLQAFNPFRTGKLVLYQVTYTTGWHDFEIIPFALLGIIGVRMILEPSVDYIDRYSIGALWRSFHQAQYEDCCMEEIVSVVSRTGRRGRHRSSTHSLDQLSKPLHEGAILGTGLLSICGVLCGPR